MKMAKPDKSARNADIYIINWVGKYETTGKVTLFTQRQVDAWLRKMRPAIVSYTLEKIWNKK